MRREAIERVGCFDPDLFGTEDWDFCLRLAQECTFAFWHGTFGVYLQHDGGISKNLDKMRTYEHLVLKKVMQSYEGIASEDRELARRELRRRLFHFAYAAYCRDEYSKAAVRFQDLLQSCGWWDKAVLFRGLCSLPVGLIARLQLFKRALSHA